MVRRGGGLSWIALGVISAGSSALAQFGPAPVAVAVVQERKVAAGQTFVGTVEPVRRSVVGSAVDGRVIEFPVNEGDRVEKDQPLAQLRTDALQIQRAAALAEQELRAQELAELENGNRPEEIEQAKARARGAKAVMDFRMQRLKRMQDLGDRRATSADEVQDAASAAEMATQNYLDSKQALDMALAGPRKEKVAQAKARVSMAQEEVHRLEDQLRKHTVVAPFAGYVVKEHTEVGQWISQAAPVAEVVDLDSVEIEIPLLEDYVPHVRLGQAARVEIAALTGQTFTGTVERIVPQADVRSRSFPVRVRVKNQVVEGEPLVKPGMVARVTLSVGAATSALLVPKDAIVLGGPSPVVFAVVPPDKKTPQATARMVPIQLGVVEGGLIEVKGELKAGDQVVFQGNERLRPGQPIAPLRGGAATAAKSASDAKPE